MKAVGEGNFTVLNVLGKDTMKGRILKDRLDIKFGDDSENYLNETDLQIGKVLKVYGRNIILIDCDGKTKEFYQQKYGIEDFTPLQIPFQSNDNSTKILPREFKLPVFNGWGSYEDSEGNCKGIEPKMPKVDFKKFLEYDKYDLAP